MPGTTNAMNVTNAMRFPKTGISMPATNIVTTNARIIVRKTASPIPSVGNMQRKAIWMQSPIAGRLPFKSSIVALTSDD